MYFLLDSKLFVFLLALVNLRLAAVHGLVCPGGECKELPDEETCETLASQKSYGTQAGTVIDSPPGLLRNCSSSCMECDPSSNVSKPMILDINFQHANSHQYLVTMRWEQPPSETDVTGYTVIISSSPSHTCNDIRAAISGDYSKQCIHLPGNYRQITFTQYYRGDSKPDNTAYIKACSLFQDSLDQNVNIILFAPCQGKLIPHPSNCSVASSSYIRPKRCHYVLPGECDTCGTHNRPPYPKEIAVNSTWDHKRILKLFIAWKLMATYYNPYPNKTYYITIHHEPGGIKAAPVLEVVGRNNVTVTLVQCSDYSVQVQFYDCGCSYSSKQYIGCIPQPNETSLYTPVPPTETSMYTPVPSSRSTVGSSSSIQPSPTQASSQVLSKSQSKLYSFSEVTEIPPTVSPRNSHPTTNSSIGTIEVNNTNSKSSSTMHYSQAITISVLVVVIVLLVVAVGFGIVVLYQCNGSTDAVDNSAHGIQQEEIAGIALPPSFIPERPTSLPHLCGECSSTHQLCRLGSDGSATTVQLLDTSPLSSPEKQEETVFIVYSNFPSVVKERYIDRIAAELGSKEGISVKMESLEYPVKGSYPQWVDETVKNSSSILCICDEQFKNEWDQGKTESLVSLVKHLFEGSLYQQDKHDMLKYAVVLLNKEDSQFIPSYLRERKCFKFMPSKFSDTIDEIAHFVTNTPCIELCIH